MPPYTERRRFFVSTVHAYVHLNILCTVNISIVFSCRAQLFPLRTRHMLRLYTYMHLNVQSSDLHTHKHSNVTACIPKALPCRALSLLSLLSTSMDRLKCICYPPTNKLIPLYACTICHTEYSCFLLSTAHVHIE